MKFDPTYPRPQMRRPGWRLLDGDWAFLEDPHDKGLRDGLYRAQLPSAEKILVPFPPESTGSGLGRDVADVIWYQRTLELPEPHAGMRLILHFEAVDYRADVWINGQYVGGHEGGQTRFSFDVTDLVRAEQNMLTVRAHDNAEDLEQPRGKQDWQDTPHVIWYRRTSGIWRSVWMEAVPHSYIADAVYRTTPTTVDAIISLEGRIWSCDQVRVVLTLDGRPLADATHLVMGDRVGVSLVLGDARLDVEPDDLMWSPERPTLIDVRIELLRDGEIIDAVDSYVGLRTAGVDDRAFLLNNRPYFLRMVLEQGYWPDTHLASPSPEALRHEAELIKNLGFNGLRVHQKTADPRFLAWCDHLGLVVWADAAASYRFSDRSFRRLASEWIEVVTRDRNHPSVVAWVAYNESWGVPHVEYEPEQQWAVRAIHATIKTLDPTRIVLGNDGWEHLVGDAVGVHDYEQDPDRLEERFGTLDAARLTVREGRTGGRRVRLTEANGHSNAPVVLTEFGGINLHDDDGAWSGYGDATDEQDLLERLGRLRVVVGENSGLAGFCYTQLTDTEQEKNGLTTAHRVPKAAVADLQRIFGSYR